MSNNSHDFEKALEALSNHFQRSINRGYLKSEKLITFYNIQLERLAESFNNEAKMVNELQEDINELVQQLSMVQSIIKELEYSTKLLELIGISTNFSPEVLNFFEKHHSFILIQSNDNGAGITNALRFIDLAIRFNVPFLRNIPWLNSKEFSSYVISEIMKKRNSPLTQELELQTYYFNHFNRIAS